MTQTLKEQDFKVDDVSEYYKKFYKAQNQIRLLVLNYLFRNISFLTRREKIRAITISEYQTISRDLEVPQILVHKFISRFLIDLLHFKKLLHVHPEILHAKTQTLGILLWKLHRIAPVFDYRRAKENAERLQKKLENLCFWPQVMTQLAIIVFITDFLDETQPQKIVQLNLRAFCCCSAYAFHRTRNKIGLTSIHLQNITS